jgi:beta-galactosidase
VELLINGTSVGRKPAGAAQQNKATFEVTYQPGTLVAIGLTGGVEQGRTELTSAGLPVALRLTPDRTTIGAATGNLSYVTVEIVDEHGALVPHATDEVSFEITGPGELIAVGTANPVSEESYVGTERKAFQGRLMAVVRSNGQEGAIRLTATASGLATAQTRVSAATPSS